MLHLFSPCRVCSHCHFYGVAFYRCCAGGVGGQGLCLRSVPCAMATVQVQNLTFWGSNDEFLLKGVTAVARPGELLGILGGSGAGKRYGLAFVPC